VWKKKYRVSLHDQAYFARQLVTMFDAGVPIHRALEFYSNGIDNDLGTIVEEVATSVESGVSLSHSFRKYPEVFSPVFVGLIEAGERTGEISPMLQRLATLLEQEANLLTRLRTALTYPVFLAIVSFIVGCIFMYVIIPTLEPMLAGMGVDPPLPTQMLMFLGRFIRHPVTLVGVPSLLLFSWFFGPTVLARLRQQPGWPERLDWIPLHLPVFGKLYRKIVVARILFTMATTIDSGLTVLTSITMGRAVTSNVHFRAGLERARKELQDGETFCTALTRAGIFPEAQVQMIAVGEETASLGEVMRKISEMGGEEAANQVEVSVQLLEPVMLFVLGIVSGFLVLAAILPLVRMIDSL
jgi:type IV pilus assembly protein PilC